MLTENERQELLGLARAAILAHLSKIEPPASWPAGALARRTGAFVTLKQQGTLRGCIGYLANDRPLVEVVARCAAAASTDDPRFAPLTLEELNGVELEISVLGQAEPIAGPEEIEVGRHGLIIEHGAYRGLLLPQVAIEWNWDCETFLGQTCIKAGLDADSWRTGVQIFRFEAEVFGEDEATA